MTEECCESCRFSRAAKLDATAIFCLRRAPPWVPHGEIVNPPCAPPDFWCGEWECRTLTPTKIRTDLRRAVEKAKGA